MCSSTGLVWLYQIESYIRSQAISIMQKRPRINFLRLRKTKSKMKAYSQWGSFISGQFLGRARRAPNTSHSARGAVGALDNSSSFTGGLWQRLMDFLRSTGRCRGRPITSGKRTITLPLCSHTQLQAPTDRHSSRALMLKRGEEEDWGAEHGLCSRL